MIYYLVQFFDLIYEKEQMAIHLRVKFGKGEEIKYISHLDLTRVWTRVLRRANVPLAYSRGFNPHPKISVAIPLPVGYTSCTEFLDITLLEEMKVAKFWQNVQPQLPDGIEVFDVQELVNRRVSLQATVKWAEYRVDLGDSFDEMVLRAKIQDVLMAHTLPRWKERRGKWREYDLRKMIDDIWLIDENSIWQGYTIGMRLQCSSQGAGRPEEVLAAMEIDVQPRVIRRENLLMSAPR